MRSLVNVEKDEEFNLLVAWLVMALKPAGPYPVLILQGEQGSAKSTTTRILKDLIDPVAAPVRAAPQSLRDLAVLAESNWIVALDNLSGLPSSLSDGLCRLSTGAGFSTRALYTDADERVFSQQRPIILNGIDAVATRQDLLDRAIVIRLPRLQGFREERELWNTFEMVRPVILAALLDGAQAGLRGLGTPTEAGQHRMADFIRWATAAGDAFGWPDDAIEQAYTDNQATALRNSLEGSAVAKAVLKLVSNWQTLEPIDQSWEGTATSLHETLSSLVFDRDRRERWPANAQVLSRHLTMLSTALRKAGVEIEFTHVGRGSEKERWIVISETGSGTQGSEGTDEMAPA